jgi:hypothetical protein
MHGLGHGYGYGMDGLGVNIDLKLVSSYGLSTGAFVAAETLTQVLTLNLVIL